MNNCSEIPTGSTYDLGVDREDAVVRLNALKQFIGYDKDSEIVKATQKSLDMAIKALEQEPKTGRWIPTYGNVKCSVCGSVKDSRDVGKATHYCDFCGAKMVEPQESEET